MKLLSKALILSALASGSLLSAATVATADPPPVVPFAQNNSISGSATNSFYQSNIDRHVTTPNDTIQVQLVHKPSAIQWNLLNANYPYQQFSGTVTISNTAYNTIATDVLNGTVFHNNYRATGATGNFDGNEYY